MIRAFVGLPVPREIARDLEAAQAGLPVGNPVPSENFHITLAFLGEHQGPVVEDFHHALTPILAPEVAIDISGLGTFGSAAPRILFAGVRRTPTLGELRKKVRRAAREAGIDLPHERYQPHVTLARFGRALNGEDTAALETFVARRIARVCASFAASEFRLYESRLGRNGPAYSVLAEYPLGR